MSNEMPLPELGAYTKVLLNAAIGDENTPLPYCQNCGEPQGAYITIAGKVVVMPVICTCEMEAKKAEEKKREYEQKQAHILALAREAFFSQEKLLEAQFFKSDNLEPETIQTCKGYVNNYLTFCKPNGTGLLFWGAPGTGKTYCASCIVNALLGDNISAVCASVPRLLDKTSKFEDIERVLSAIETADLVVMDDIGAEYGSEFKLEKLYQLVNARYTSKKTTIYTTNLSLEKLRFPTNMTLQRIYSRILETCLPVECKVNRRDIYARRLQEKAKKIFGV